LNQTEGDIVHNWKTCHIYWPGADCP